MSTNWSASVSTIFPSSPTESWNTTSTAVWCSNSCWRSSWVVLTTATPSWSIFRVQPSPQCNKCRIKLPNWVMGHVDHVRSVLHELHWLPILLRVKFKVTLLMFLVHANQCLAYISEAVTSVSCGPLQRRLRSSDGTNYTTATTGTKFREKAFSVAGSSFWISLTEHICSTTNKHCFKRCLETYYFNIHFITP